MAIASDGVKDTMSKVKDLTPKDVIPEAKIKE